LATNEVATSWIKNLPKIITIINKKKAIDKEKEVNKPINLNGRCEGDSCNILEIGQKVRLISDQPRDSTGNKLKGKHRVTDLRWEPTIRVIDNVQLMPSQPPMYSVKDKKFVLYTRNQLSLVD
jgi:hypothetical protein